MDVWQGVAMDSLMFHQGLPCPTLLRLVGGTPLKRLEAVFYPLGNPTPYAYAQNPSAQTPF
jgi:hypothetical protein